MKYWMDFNKMLTFNLCTHIDFWNQPNSRWPLKLTDPNQYCQLVDFTDIELKFDFSITSSFTDQIIKDKTVV